MQLKAERDENTCRKDFTLSEAVAMGRALEALERPKAKERQSKAGPAEGKGKKSGSEKFSEAVQGRTLDKVGAAVGISRITYERAKAVVDAAKEDPSLQPMVDEMDRRGKVNGVYERVKQIQAKQQRAKLPKKTVSVHRSPAALPAGAPIG